MKAINEILGITPQEYELKVFDIWFTWCANRSIDIAELQMLLANSAINKWFIDEMRYHEKEFRERITPFINTASKQDIENCYKITSSGIYGKYPKPLTDEVSKSLSNIKITLTHNLN